MTDLKPVSSWEICGGSRGNRRSVSRYLKNRQKQNPVNFGFAVDFDNTQIAEDAMLVDKSSNPEIAHTAIVDVGELDTCGVGVLTLLGYLAKNKNPNKPPSGLDWKAPGIGEMSFRKIGAIPVLDFNAPFSIEEGIDWEASKIEKKIALPEVMNYGEPDLLEKLQSLKLFSALFTAETEGIRLADALDKIDNPHRIVTAHANFASVLSAKQALREEIPLVFRNAHRNETGIISEFSSQATGHCGMGGLPRAFVSRPVLEPASYMNMMALSYYIENKQPLFNARGASFLATYLNLRRTSHPH